MTRARMVYELIGHEMPCLLTRPVDLSQSSEWDLYAAWRGQYQDLLIYQLYAYPRRHILFLYDYY